MVIVKLEPTWKILFKQEEVRKQVCNCGKAEMQTPPNCLFL